MSTPAKIKQVAAYLQTGIRGMAQKIQFPENTLRSYMAKKPDGSPKVQSGIELLKALITHIEGFNVHWWLLNKGKMIMAESTGSGKVQAELTSLLRAALADKEEKIVLLQRIAQLQRDSVEIHFKLPAGTDIARLIPAEPAPARKGKVKG